ncbi:MAG TPA: hypothetical protein VKT18_06295 [Acidimicrobiales bacterium]|nr:hypothetical protein [Acidimicrobiales bacterium]
MRQRWLSKRAVSLHLRLALIVAGCAAATWWQAARALSGNGLSWFYTFEWPAFIALSVAGWWHLLHEDPERFRARTQRRAPAYDPPVGAAEGLDDYGLADPYRVRGETVVSDRGE